MGLLASILAVFSSPPQQAAAKIVVANPVPPADDVSQAVLDEIERNEGCVLHAYRDCVGVLTIGYGHTGDDVYPGRVITQDEAQALLQQDLQKFEDGVDGLLGDVEASDNEFGAMVSLAYNIGLGNFGHSSVLRLHKARRFDEAADAFLLWNKAGGRVSAGLSRRRAEERRIYLTPDDE